MNQTIIVCGHGPGISEAVARKFGGQGLAVAIVARNAERLSKSAAALSAAGVKAQAFPCDLAKPAAARVLVREVRAALGPIAVIHWNAYQRGAGDLTATLPGELEGTLNVAVHGMLATLQEALPDLRAQKGALLVTGGGLAFYDPEVDKKAVEWGAMGLAVAKAAQHKVTGLLNARLASEGVYVGEVVVTGIVKGTAFDAAGHGTVESTAVAEKFWELYQGRDRVSVSYP